MVVRDEIRPPRLPFGGGIGDGPREHDAALTTARKNNPRWKKRVVMVALRAAAAYHAVSVARDIWLTT